jgi:hypothetical protein
MTLVNTETGELIDVLSKDEAERLSTRISLRLETISDNYVAVMPMIREAVDRQAHLALGYASPGAYISDRFGDSLSKLGVEVRREVVRELTAAGLSTRAIAPVVGVSQSTIRDDVSSAYSPETVRSNGLGHKAKSDLMEFGPDDKFVCKNCHATFGVDRRNDTPRGWVCNECHDIYIETEQAATLPPPAVVVGVDGKKYPRPTRTRQAHRPDAEVLLNLVETEARKAATTASKLTADQIGRVKPKADLWTVGLRESVETLQRLLTSLESENK